MNRADDPAVLNTCFVTLEKAACEGARCPKNGEQGVQSDITTALAKAGRIKIEVSGHNYRTITILDGPNAGKRTRPDPHQRPAYLVVSKAGTLRNGEPIDMSANVLRKDFRERENERLQRRGRP